MHGVIKVTIMSSSVKEGDCFDENYKKHIKSIEHFYDIRFGLLRYCENRFQSRW